MKIAIFVAFYIMMGFATILVDALISGDDDKPAPPDEYVILLFTIMWPLFWVVSAIEHLPKILKKLYVLFVALVFCIGALFIKEKEDE